MMIELPALIRGSTGTKSVKQNKWYTMPIVTNSYTTRCRYVVFSLNGSKYKIIINMNSDVKLNRKIAKLGKLFNWITPTASIKLLRG
jgi:hypothetical protein